MNDYLNQYISLIQLYFPLGIIGVWRWSLWLYKKSVSLFYRIPKGNYSSTLSIVAPVYNEDPEIFKKALASWKNNRPEEIIAVIDYTDRQSLDIFKNFSKNFEGAKLIITHTPGKRPAIADGVRASRGEIVALVDSDTIWESGLKRKILDPFADPQVGGVAPRQDVFRRDTLARKLFEIRLNNRYDNELAYLATAGNAITCISGRTAVYRREAIIDLLTPLVNEKFLGQPVISGDDKTLTHLVQSQGWKVKYVDNALVYTFGAADLGTYIRQQIRWTRNSWRGDLKAAFSAWPWKREKFLAFHLTDRFIQPFVLMIGPIYFFVSLYFGYWQVALALFVWWHISRTILVFGHFRRHPADILILPIYIAMTYIFGVLKIYAFFTIYRQGWITRWDKGRLLKTGWVKEFFSWSATMALLVLMFSGIAGYKTRVIEARESAQQAKLMKALKPVKNLYDINLAYQNNNINFFSKAEVNLDNQKKEAAADLNNKQYAYYQVKKGDNVERIRRKFNLSSAAMILDSQKKSIAGQNFLLVGQSLMISVSDFQKTPLKVAYQSRGLTTVRYDSLENTIYIEGGGDSVVTLSQVKRLLPLAQQNLLEQLSSGEWILRANLFVRDNNALVIDGDEVNHLKLKSDSSGFVWIRSENGSLYFYNTKVTSWDEQQNAPDENYRDGRSFVLAKKSGRMDIVNSEMSYLGYLGFPKRGGPFGGSYGVSWKVTSGRFKNDLLSGKVIESKFHHNFFGLYTFGVTAMIVRNNDVYANIAYGIDPHDDSNNMIIENNRTYNNGTHGIIISKRCFNNIIRNNVSYNNKLHGIMLDRESNGNIIQGNKVYGNYDGIAIYNSHNNLLIDNEIANNIHGIRLNVGSSKNFAQNNQIKSNRTGLHIYQEARQNYFYQNQVADNQIGVTLKKTYANVLADNGNYWDNKKHINIDTESCKNFIQ